MKILEINRDIQMIGQPVNVILDTLFHQIFPQYVLCYVPYLVLLGTKCMPIQITFAYKIHYITAVYYVISVVPNTYLLEWIPKLQNKKTHDFLAGFSIKWGKTGKNSNYKIN